MDWFFEMDLGLFYTVDLVSGYHTSFIEDSNAYSYSIATDGQQIIIIYKAKIKIMQTTQLSLEVLKIISIVVIFYITWQATQATRRETAFITL